MLNEEIMQILLEVLDTYYYRQSPCERFKSEEVDGNIERPRPIKIYYFYLLYLSEILVILVLFYEHMLCT